MAKDYASLTNSILEELGGAKNVSGLFHCATRLRFRLNDKSIVRAKQIEAIPGVLGTVDDAAGIQVVIGNDVKKAYATLMEQHPEMAELSGGAVEDDGREPERTNIVKRLLNMLSAVVGPVIPLIMCSGLVSALLVILTTWGGLSPESSTYTLLNMVGTGALYFLPVFVAYTSAKRFGCDVMTSLFLGALLISPTLIGMVEAGSFVDLFGLPVKTGDYTSTLIPAILTIWVYSHVEKLVDRIVPDAVKFVFRPLLGLVIMLPVMLCVTAPLGNYVGGLLNSAMTAINDVAPWASVLVVGCLAPLLVLTGMHLALIPLVMTSFATVGYDNMLFVAFIGMNFSQFGVALACFLKSKNANLKALSLSCAITAFFAGVTEPALYGISVRMKRPLVATWLACVVDAVFCAICSVKVFQFGAPSFFTMPIFLNPDGTMGNFYFAIAAAAISIIVAFVATWALGFDDSVYGEQKAAA